MHVSYSNNKQKLLLERFNAYTIQTLNNYDFFLYKNSFWVCFVFFFSSLYNTIWCITVNKSIPFQFGLQWNVFYSFGQINWYIEVINVSKWQECCSQRNSMQQAKIVNASPYFMSKKTKFLNQRCDSVWSKFPERIRFPILLCRAEFSENKKFLAKFPEKITSLLNLHLCTSRDEVQVIHDAD